MLLKPSVDRQLKRLPEVAGRRIVLAMDGLASDPRPAGVKKLAGDENLWRIRVGTYRIVYEIHDDLRIVWVLRIAQRGDVYRRK